MVGENSLKRIMNPLLNAFCDEQNHVMSGYRHCEIFNFKNKIKVVP